MKEIDNRAAALMAATELALSAPCYESTRQLAEVVRWVVGNMASRSDLMSATMQQDPFEIERKAYLKGVNVALDLTGIAPASGLATQIYVKAIRKFNEGRLRHDRIPEPSDS